MTPPADNHLWHISRNEFGEATLFLEGDWMGRGPVPQQLISGKDSPKRVTLDLTKLGKWDSGLAAFVFNVKVECDGLGIPLDFAGISGDLKNLYELAVGAPPKQLGKADKVPWLARVGFSTVKLYKSSLSVCNFIGEILFALGRLLTGRARMQWRDVLTELVKAGPGALLIVALIGFLMGFILAFIGAIPLGWFSAEIYVASLIGIGICRMMGGVMTGVVMAGRTGASFAAELGNMQANEEIDALESMGISSMEFLVLPRFISLVLMMPILGIFADIVGILGGMIVAITYMGISLQEYWQTLVDTTSLKDFGVGLFTTFVFGVLISICGCYRGMKCGRSSVEVGEATTAAMVSSLICLIIATAVITVVTVLLQI